MRITSELFSRHALGNQSTDKSADDSKRNVEPKALALPINDLASDEASN